MKYGEKWPRWVDITIYIGLFVGGLVWRPAMWALAIFLAQDWLGRRWDELLGAIRQRRQTREPASRGDGSAADSSASKEGVHTGTIPREGIFTVPREPTLDELERARKALHEREAQLREAQAERERAAVKGATIAKGHDPRTCPLCLGGGHPIAKRENQQESERQREGEEREQEAREFLVRESARVLKEREEREAAQKREREAEANRPRWLH